MILGDLATALELDLQGNADEFVEALAPLERAGPTELAFIVSARYADALRNTRAGAVILPESLRNIAPSNCLISPDPYASYASASWLLNPQQLEPAGIHPTAMLADSARVAASACVGPGTVVGADSVIEDNVVIGAHCVIGQGVRLGKGTRLFARVSLYENVVLGEKCRIQSGVVIGSEGFGYAWTNSGWRQIHQTGGVRIGDRVHVGANTVIDCGAMDPTVIEDGVILDNQIQIAHNVRIGENTAIAGCVGIAGSTRIGRNCRIGGACNIVGHLEIVDGVVLNAAALVTRSITEPGRYGSGVPLQRDQAWRRSFVSLGRLDELFRRVRKLERRERDN